MCKRHVQNIRERCGNEQDTLQEIREYEGDLGHVQETICRRSENINRYRTCPRDNVHEISGNNQERKDIL